MHVTCGHCRPCRTGQRHICENTKILGVHGDGCFAQYVVVPAFNVVPLDRDVVPPKVGAFLDALGNAVHTTQVADLSGKSVAVLGYGPIGAMCAEIARISGASHIAITEVNAQAAAHARRWAQLARRAPRRPSSTSRARRTRREACATRSAAAPTSCSSSRARSRPSTSAWPRPGAAPRSRCSACPRGKAVTIRDYTNDFIFKGLTLHAIVGRRIFDTWIKMLDLLRAGLEVEDLVTNEFEGLEKFHEAMELLENRKAMKVVFYPNGKPRGGT